MTGRNRYDKRPFLLLTVLLFGGFFFQFHTASADITTGLVGYWTFDEGSGTTAVDSSGNGNTGTLNGSMTGNDWVPGKYGSSLDFDGSDDYINVDDVANLTHFYHKLLPRLLYKLT